MTYKGGFYFERTDDVTLSGHYLESRNNAPQRETCRRIPDDFTSDDLWEGNYETDWDPPDGSRHTTNLTIRKEGEIYSFNWTRLRSDGTPYDLSYIGTAMLVHDRMLIGGYFSTR